MSTFTNKEELAALLNGREYMKEIAHDENALAEQLGLVVVFGYSDGNVELRGAINDEIGCGDDITFRVCAKGIVEQPDDEERRTLQKFGLLTLVTALGAPVRALWGQDGYSWTYQTAIPHATFEIMDDGEKYCRGIVFNLPA